MPAFIFWVQLQVRLELGAKVLETRAQAFRNGQHGCAPVVPPVADKVIYLGHDAHAFVRLAPRAETVPACGAR